MRIALDTNVLAYAAGIDDARRRDRALGMLETLSGAALVLPQQVAGELYNVLRRKGAHPADHLASFSGVMHADGYGGYKKLYGNQIVEAACMAHVRRKFHDVIKLKPSPIAEEALARIGALYDIENRIRGMAAAERRTLRQHHARPVLDGLKAWIETTLSTLPQKQKLAEAMRYALSRWAALSVYMDDGRVEIDNNIA